MDREERGIREIRIVLSGRRLVLAGLLTGLLFFAAAAGSLLLAGMARTEKASAYGTHNAGAKTWLFAEGYTGEGFDEYILVYNPIVPFGSGSEIKVRLGLTGPNGVIGYYDSPIIQSGQRWTVKINEICAGFGYEGDVSVAVNSILDPNRAPFVCERAMYYTYQTPLGPVTGGSQVLGYQEGAAE